METWFSNLWDKTKAFFKRSEVIFYSRLQVIGGFILAVIGQVNWNSLTTWDWTTPKQNVWLGFGLIVNGLVTELLRRRNMTTGV